jgi:hypothetical protein
MRNDLQTSEEFRQFLQEGAYDFLDFGCSRGDSIVWGKRLFSGNRGLGIDIDSKKIAAAHLAGLDAKLFDIKDIPREKLVRFTIMNHFLEHVPSIEDVKTFIKRACQVSTDFVFIKQPYFDADGYLFQKGLKMFWSDWTGHPNPMSTLSFYRILSQLQNEGVFQHFSIHGKKAILSSDDDHVQSAFAPTDQHHFDKNIHPPKVTGLNFQMPVFYETVVFITMPGVVHRDPFNSIKTDITFIDEFEKFSGK